MRKYLIAAATAAALLTTATGCAGGSSSASSQPTTLSLSQIAAPDSFAPGNFGTGPNSQYLQPVYDSLLRNDEKGEPTPNVATEWSYDATQTTLSLTLRDGITFTDGSKLDAAAVKTGLEAAKKGTGEAGGQLRELKSVDVVDPTHVKLILTAPDPSLLPNLGGNAGMLASPAAVGKESLKTVPVGSGPYVLDKAQTQAGNKYVYTRNNSYWGDKKSYPYDTINITVFNDNNAMENALRSGQIDSAVVPSKDVASLKSAGLNVVSLPAYTTSGLFLFDREGKLAPALADVRVRQAINYAFDRDAIVKQAYGGAGTSTAQLFSTDSSAYDEALNGKYTYDVAKAKQLLAEAGYANGFELKMPDVSPIYPAQQAATTEALKAIGITPVYEPVNGQTFISDLLGGKYPAAIFGLDSHRSWDIAQLALAPESLWNTLHVSDPKVVSLIGQAQKETGDQQVQTFKKLNEYVVDQAWFAPWIQPNNDFAISKKVTVKPQKFSTALPIWNFAPAS